MDRTKLIETLSRLVILKQDLSEGDVEEKYIRIYHETLSELEKASEFDLSKYRIPESELHYRQEPDTRGNRPFIMKKNYSNERYCDWKYFLVQLDTVLLWFEFETQRPEQRPIGFRPPQ